MIGESRLTEYGKKYGTDKVQHGYLPIYESYLEPMRATATKILEIGIAGGASLRMWRDYFPMATVLGVDHNDDYCKSVVGEDHIIPVFGGANHAQTWNAIREERDNFDLIVDDGSHTTANIIEAFKFAFPLVRSGGYYAIEDMHCSFDPDYQRDNHHVGNVRNALDYFKAFTDAVTINGAYPVESIHFHKNLVVIRKR